MRYSFRFLFTVAAVVIPCFAQAAEVWDAPAFSLSAAQLLQASNAIKRERATDVVVLLDERAFVIDEQNRLTRTTRLIYRVDSPEGVERWAASTARWQPWHQARPTIRARVITRDGVQHEIDEKLLTDAATRSDEDQVFDDEHSLEGPLPAVSIGSVIEEQITVRDEKPFFAAGSVYKEYVGRPMPVLHTRVTIDAPQSLPLKHLTELLPDAQVQETRADGRIHWSLEQGNIDEMEESVSNLPPDEPSWPNVQFSSAASWEAIAASYRELTEPRIRDDDAKPLLAGLKTPLPRSPTREYIGKIVERLHREVRYTGVEFGDARLIPEFPAETLRRKFGDCKDKSTLLVAALRAAGIEAYLALLSSGNDQDVSPDLPGLGMFDHAIVFVPGADDLWIDATAEYTRVGVLPAPDTNRLALIIRTGEKQLTRTPTMRSSDNRQVETREFLLDEYGPARAIETTETFGTVEGEFRSWYAGADTKARVDDLKTYARDAYRAKSLTDYVHGSSTDFSKPYSMRLDMKDASVGFTDLAAAAVGIKVSNIVSRLPDYFDERIKDEDTSDDVPRKADVVFEPFVVEWQYRVVPPPGFQARKLPPSGVLALGPAQLISEFNVTADGAIHAMWRFDTVKGRYTPAETDALIKAIRELNKKETQLLSFDQIGVALRADGDFKGALRANETLVAKYPRKAVHRLRSASALLDAGLGARAQREALAATKLEPKSALAWKTYGWMLQHDAVGRRFGEGFDRAAAIAAYRKAHSLAPDDTDIAADLAVLLEHDVNGVRYSPASNLDEAIKTYQERRAKLSEEDAADDDFAKNLHYALLYAHRYAELRELLRKQSPSNTQRALMLAAMGAEQGSSAALELARTLTSGEKDRRAALASAGSLLVRLREYQTAADLIEAGTRGDATTAANTQRIATLRKTERNDGKTSLPTDPRGVVLRWFAELLSNRSAPADEDDALRKLLAPGSEQLLDGVDFTRAQRTVVTALARQDLPFEVAADILFSNVRVNVEGDDARGYRVQLRMPGQAQTFYVVKVGEAYRILTVTPALGPIAVRALDLVDAGDFAGARQWLDWARLEMKAANADDALAGPAFARAWTVGADSDLAHARTAAALLLADSGMSDRALTLLKSAQPADAAERLNLDVALATSYLDLQQWEPLREVSARLVATAPASAIAFRDQQMALIQLKEWDAAESAARERLARLPDDSLAREMQVYRAEARGSFGEIRGIMQPLLDSGRATASDYNQYAWSALLMQPVDDKAVDAARVAYDETQGNSYSIGHTLACVYAATGKPREARDLLLKGMELVGISKPDDSAWYGFGLIAEAYGDTESARGYYAKVEKPRKGVLHASSVYTLSQVRLAALK